jgi:2-amino-4-hydroxy-6-hydroxymethyldihydropteridine diphosphokinase
VTTAVLSIGANVGDRRAALQSAVDGFRPWLVAVSPVYETPPWGPVPQDDYLNAVLLVRDDDASPADWLARAHAAEQAAGRTREVRWGPRTLDVDVVAVDDVVSDDPTLTLPHPRATERAFVLVPWRAVQPDAKVDTVGIDEWIARLPAAEVATVRMRADQAVS